MSVGPPKPTVVGVLDTFDTDASLARARGASRALTGRKAQPTLRPRPAASPSSGGGSHLSSSSPRSDAKGSQASSMPQSTIIYDSDMAFKDLIAKFRGIENEWSKKSGSGGGSSSSSLGRSGISTSKSRVTTMRARPPPPTSPKTPTDRAGAKKRGFTNPSTSASSSSSSAASGSSASSSSMSRKPGSSGIRGGRSGTSKLSVGRETSNEKKSASSAGALLLKKKASGKSVTRSRGPTKSSKMTAEMVAVVSERDELQTVVKSLLKEIETLKAHNESMSKRMSELNEALGRSKTFAESLIGKVDSMNEELQFQSDLHKSERTAWKKALVRTATEGDVSAKPALATKLSSKVSSTITGHKRSDTGTSDTGIPGIGALADMSWIQDMSRAVESQHELVKFKEEQLRQDRLVHEQNIVSLKQEFTKEIQHMRVSHAQEMDHVLSQLEAEKLARASESEELERALKLQMMTAAELDASKKQLDSMIKKTAKVSGDDSDESKLLRLERNYMNIMENAASLQRSLHSTEEQKKLLMTEVKELKESELQSRQKMLEMKETISLLQRNLEDSKKDRSDLIAYLQRECQESKEALIKTKDKLHETERKLDELHESRVLWGGGVHSGDDESDEDSLRQRPLQFKSSIDTDIEDEKMSERMHDSVDYTAALGPSRLRSGTDAVVKAAHLEEEIAGERRRNEDLSGQILTQQMIIDELRQQSAGLMKKQDKLISKIKRLQNTIQSMHADHHIEFDSGRDLFSDPLGSPQPPMKIPQSATPVARGGSRARQASRPAVILGSQIDMALSPSSDGARFAFGKEMSVPGSGAAGSGAEKTVLFDVSALLSDLSDYPGELKSQVESSISTVIASMNEKSIKMLSSLFGDVSDPTSPSAIATAKTIKDSKDKAASDEALLLSDGVEALIRSLVADRQRLQQELYQSRTRMEYVRTEASELTDIHHSNVQKLEKHLAEAKKANKSLVEDKQQLEKTVSKLYRKLGEAKTELTRSELFATDSGRHQSLAVRGAGHSSAYSTGGLPASSVPSSVTSMTTFASPTIQHTSSQTMPDRGAILRTMLGSGMLEVAIEDNDPSESDDDEMREEDLEVAMPIETALGLASKRSGDHRTALSSTGFRGMSESAAMKMAALHAENDDLRGQILQLERDKASIAKEYEREAVLWMNSRAEVESDRVNFQNELTRMVSQLEKILEERREYQKSSKQWKCLYLAVLEELESMGFEVEIDLEYDEYGDVLSAKAQSLTVDPETGMIMGDYDDTESIRISVTARSSRAQTTEVPSYSPSMSGRTRRIGSTDDFDLDTSSVRTSKPTSPLDVVKASSMSMRVLSPQSSSKKQSATSSVVSLFKFKERYASSSPKFPSKSKSNPMEETDSMSPKSPRSTGSASPRTGRKKKRDAKAIPVKSSSLGPTARSMNATCRITGVGMDEDLPSERMSIGRTPMSPTTVSSAMSRKRDESYDPSDDYVFWSDPGLYEFLDEEYLQFSAKLKFERDYILTTMGDDADYKEFNAEEISARQVEQDLIEKEKTLPVLRGWLEKQSPSFHKGWQKRYVLVMEYNIFYMKKEVSVRSAQEAQEHPAFQNVIPLVVVQYVAQSDAHKTGRKFEVVAMDPRSGDRRVYQWRAESRDQCLDWVEGLNDHKKLLTAKMLT